MANHSSAREREETPHVISSTNNVTSSAKKKTLNFNGASKNNLSNALKRRAQSLIKNKSIDAQSRALIRYGLETNDPWLSFCTAQDSEPGCYEHDPQISEAAQQSLAERVEEAVKSPSSVTRLAGYRWERAHTWSTTSHH